MSGHPSSFSYFIPARSSPSYFILESPPRTRLLKWFPELTDKISIPRPGLFNIQFAYFTPWSVYKTFINFSNQILNHINIQLHLYKFKIFKFNINSIYKSSIHKIYSHFKFQKINSHFKFHLSKIYNIYIIYFWKQFKFQNKYFYISK